MRRKSRRNSTAARRSGGAGRSVSLSIAPRWSPLRRAKSTYAAGPAAGARSGPPWTAVIAPPTS
ncbi:hypothetical protein [Kitasatospora sp. NPDC057500]|uniref:hypothetical protein n=1 Tax=Kitasatospora sp. NPDC057500 TaxID=3346151 RepID=UPI00368742C3